jgi:hypothetical protein
MCGQLPRLSLAKLELLLFTVRDGFAPVSVY